MEAPKKAFEGPYTHCGHTVTHSTGLTSSPFLQDLDVVSTQGNLVVASPSH
jgi:hypothetical protein